MSFFPAKGRTKFNKHRFDVNNTTTTLSELVFMEYNPKWLQNTHTHLFQVHMTHSSTQITCWAIRHIYFCWTTDFSLQCVSSHFMYFVALVRFVHAYNGHVFLSGWLVYHYTAFSCLWLHHIFPSFYFWPLHFIESSVSLSHRHTAYSWIFKKKI